MYNNTMMVKNSTHSNFSYRQIIWSDMRVRGAT